jgi:hypothetical protein
MRSILDNPALVFLISFLILWLSVRLGTTVASKRPPALEAERDDLGVILGATLTLLGLIIGFTFSMAISRYDQRKNLEEAEANAIGTEFVRADVLPAADAAKVRALLKSYLDQRVLFYNTRGTDQLRQVNAATSQLQNDLWTAVRAPAQAQPTPISALAMQGMNDVLNSQGYTQAAWWNRIPTAAWMLMAAISICSNLLVGFYAYHLKGKGLLALVLPLVLSISFLLIADIDSPRGGIIRVRPQNLISLAQSLPAN